MKSVVEKMAALGIAKAQIHLPVLSGRVIRLLVASGSSSKQSAWHGRTNGLEAASVAAGRPARKVRYKKRTDGILAAAYAAGIPGAD